MFSKLRELRHFLLFWLGQTVSQFGSAMTAFALIIYAYKQHDSVMSVALLCVCSYVPNALCSLFCGPIIDRFNKKSLMLWADTGAAIATLGTLMLMRADLLSLPMLYLINGVLGICGAFQTPASIVATSLLAPREHYMRVSGMQSFTSSLKDILAPVLAAALLSAGGLEAVIFTDLSTFAFAFLTLLLFIKLPNVKAERHNTAYIGRLLDGLSYLRREKGVAHIVLYSGLLNLIAGIAYYSVLSPMILARTGGSDQILALVNSFIGIGAMAGGILVAIKAPGGSKATIMCVSYMLSFALCDMTMGLGRSVWLWCAAALLGSLPLPFGDAAMMTLLRQSIPAQMQGRVFSVRQALIYTLITIGYLLGGYLADYVCEPFADAIPFIRTLIGHGDGRSMGLIFMLSGLVGALASLVLLRDRSIRELEKR